MDWPLIVKGNPVVIAVRQKAAMDLKERAACGENFWMDVGLAVGEIRKLCEEEKAKRGEIMGVVEVRILATTFPSVWRKMGMHEAN